MMPGEIGIATLETTKACMVRAITGGKSLARVVWHWHGC